MPMYLRPSRRATAPVVPVPKNGSRMMSPGLVEARITRCSRASGFWVGCALAPVSSFSRSSPVHNGSDQSERICSSSLAIFMAS
jgi:hypothetical protein